MSNFVLRWPHFDYAGPHLGRNAPSMPFSSDYTENMTWSSHGRRDRTLRGQEIVQTSALSVTGDYFNGDR